MKALLIGFALAIAVGLAFLYFQREDEYSGAVVARVADGDTIDLVDGRRVRLVQIDTPEQGTECYGHDASAATRRLLPRGTRVRIEQDPGLDQVDRYERTLAYVWKGDEAVNVTLVREGAAGVWFFGGTRGRLASELLSAAGAARASARACGAPARSRASIRSSRSRAGRLRPRKPVRRGRGSSQRAKAGRRRAGRASRSGRSAVRQRRGARTSRARPEAPASGR